MQEEFRGDEEEEGEVDEDERDRASVGGGHEGGEDDEPGCQDRHHVGQQRVGLADMLRTVKRISSSNLCKIWRVQFF